jgi:hypothetical protein
MLAKAVFSVSVILSSLAEETAAILARITKTIGIKTIGFMFSLLSICLLVELKLSKI